MNNRKYKKLGDTQELDSAAIRRAMQKSGKNVQSQSKTVSKGGGRNANRVPDAFLSSSSPSRKVTAPGKSTSQKKRKPSSANKKKRSPKNDNRKYSSNDIQRKKHSKKKKKTRRFVRAIVFFVIILAIIFLMGFIIIKLVFKVDNIAVSYSDGKAESSSAKHKYTVSQIIGASGVIKGDNLVLCDKEEVKDNIEMKLPYIEVKQVDKKGTGTVTITVTERKASFAFSNGGGYCICDKDLKILEVTSEKDKVKQCAVIKGAKAENPVVGEYIFADGSSKSVKNVIDAVNSSKIKKLTEIDLSNMKSIKMTYDGRIKILLGDEEGLEAKLELGAKTLAEEDANSPMQEGELNLTIPKKAYFKGN